MEKHNVRILVCTHKEGPVRDDDIYMPVQVGKSASTIDLGCQGDDVAGYIEYKNKTQEKCNYCTTYQCISVFYKKNVELHLLLILAIDSVIYSFYVTILLCKKAPVFD